MDEEGNHLLGGSAREEASCRAGGEFYPCDSGMAVRLPEDFLSARDKRYYYAGFLAANGCRLSVEPDSVRLRLSRRKRGPAGKEEMVLYAGPSGTPLGDGSREHPLDLQTALEECLPGREVVALPGEYHFPGNLVIRRENCGTQDKKKKLRVAPEARAEQAGSEGRAPGQETPSAAVLDFEGKPCGFLLEGDYWDISGISVVRGLGFQVQGSHNHLRDCKAAENLETGFLLRHALAASPKEEWPSYNTLEDCVSCCNADPSEHNADGFACKIAAGEGNRFIRCTSFLNSDDGFDLFAKNRAIGAVELTGCRSILNGYRLMPGGSLRETAGNGNGFKLGGSGLLVKHTVRDCLAMGNRRDGFTSNSNPWFQLIRCASLKNRRLAYGFFFTGRSAVPHRELIECREEAGEGFEPALWAESHVRKVGRWEYYLTGKN